MMMRGRILLVDDNLDFLDSTKDVLEDGGYRVDTATNGKDALIQATNNPYDVILMDIKMPGMNGVESYIRMKEKNPTIKVILISAYSLEDLIKRAREEGVCEVLNKPLNMVKLLDNIERIKQSRVGGCILVADDDRALCDNLFDVLTRRGYQVVVAGSGDEAVKKAEDEPFDILLLDMKLPHSNGLEVYRRVKPLQSSLVTIIMTGYAEEMQELIDQTLSEDAYTCLRKPLKIEALIKLLDEVSEAKQKGVVTKDDSAGY
jgi:two-component system, NtrC family, response regulator HydG